MLTAGGAQPLPRAGVRCPGGAGALLCAGPARLRAAEQSHRLPSAPLPLSKHALPLRHSAVLGQWPPHPTLFPRGRGWGLRRPPPYIWQGAGRASNLRTPLAARPESTRRKPCVKSLRFPGPPMGTVTLCLRCLYTDLPNPVYFLIQSFLLPTLLVSPLVSTKAAPTTPTRS